MAKRKAFGESPQEMLLKRRLGTAKYEQMKKDFKPQIPKRPVGNLIYDEAGVWEQKKLDAWKFGKITEFKPGAFWTIGGGGEFYWNGTEINTGKEKEPEKTPEEIRDDWAEKWVAEQT